MPDSRKISARRRRKEYKYVRRKADPAAARISAGIGMSSTRSNEHWSHTGSHGLSRTEVMSEEVNRVVRVVMRPDVHRIEDHLAQT